MQTFCLSPKVFGYHLKFSAYQPIFLAVIQTFCSSFKLFDYHPNFLLIIQSFPLSSNPFGYHPNFPLLITQTFRLLSKPFSFHSNYSNIIQTFHTQKLILNFLTHTIFLLVLVLVLMPYSILVFLRTANMSNAPSWVGKKDISISKIS